MPSRSGAGYRHTFHSVLDVWWSVGYGHPQAVDHAILPVATPLTSSLKSMPCLLPQRVSLWEEKRLSRVWLDRDLLRPTRNSSMWCSGRCTATVPGMLHSPSCVVYRDGLRNAPRKVPEFTRHGTSQCCGALPRYSAVHFAFFPPEYFKRASEKGLPRDRWYPRSMILPRQSAPRWIHVCS